MDEDWNGLEWTLDGAAALLFAGAAGWAGWVAFGIGPAFAIAVAALMAALAALKLVPPPAFALKPFVAAEWDLSVAPELLELTDAIAAASGEEGPQSTVVRLFAARTPLPNAGELRERIEHHLRQRQSGVGAEDQGDVVLLGADASAALRRALRELKSSLG